MKRAVELFGEKDVTRELMDRVIIGDEITFLNLVLSGEDINDAKLYTGLEMIFNTRQSSNKNSFAEWLMFANVVLEGIFGLSSDVVEVLVKEMSAFKLVSEVMNCGSRAVETYKKMYESYVKSRTSVEEVIERGVERVFEALKDLVDNVDEINLDKMKEEMNLLLKDIKL